MKIYYQEAEVHDGRKGFRWGWQEAWTKKVLGWSPTLEDVKRRAQRMFPGKAIELSML